jgi:hypothetical protein
MIADEERIVLPEVRTNLLHVFVGLLSPELT